jgi:mannose-6-phosphate isomerase
VQSIFHLSGSIKHYEWGGFSFIPALVGSHNYHHEPFAEYWMGVHPADPSKISFENQSLFLPDFIRENKDVVMGKTAKRFDNLPFLLKVLDVREMLSIQVHPDASQATEGFEKENAAGIALDSGKRNYKDKSHKPELMVALSEFWLLHGFKREKELLKTLKKVPELEIFIGAFKEGSYKQLFEMSYRDPASDRALQELGERILPLYDAGKLKKDSADFWAARAMKTFCKDRNLDRGIFSIYFLNLLKLEEGEGIFQDAGLPHAYLEGQNIEVMASSDNVLRAGLTSKHIDMEELLRLVKFEATRPDILYPKKGKKTAYKSPAKEFCLTRYCFDGKDDAFIKLDSPAILFNLDADIILRSEEDFHLYPGNSVFIIAGTEVEVIGRDAEVYVVSIPEDKI